MRILVLSDLHTGTDARTKDLCPYPEGLLKDDEMINSFLETCKSYISENGNFNYLVLPGDVTNKSNLIEYLSAEGFIKRITDELAIAPERIVFVPGNHDVDWSVLEGKTIFAEEQKLRRKYKYNTLGDDSHIFSGFSAPELVTAPFIKKWEYDDAIFFGYNSSWHADSLQHNHYGLIDKTHLESLKTMLDALEAVNKLKVFVIHHHVYPYHNPHPKWKDISVLQNAQLLLDMLYEYAFQFVIHGHRHVPNFLSTRQNNFTAINFLCAGSYSCQVHSDIAGSVGNLFHIIEFDDISSCKGRVISKGYHATEYKWVNSKENYGIEHINPFGSEVSYDELKQLCFVEIENLLRKSDKAEFNDLFEVVPDLKYSHNASQKKLIADIEKQYALKACTFGDQEIIFVKRKNV